MTKKLCQTQTFLFKNGVLRVSTVRTQLLQSILYLYLLWRSFHLWKIGIWIPSISMKTIFHYVIHTSNEPQSLNFYYSTTIAFFKSLSTVSEGRAPTASHFLIAGALRLASFFKGSYQPRYSRGAPSRLLRESTATIR